MSLAVIELARVAAQRWRNGGGATRELFTWPAGAADWQLRISVAAIERDGPFSPYPGVERWFAVVDGAGVALRFADDECLLDGNSAPLRFDGALAPGCRLRRGATRDLNLMLRQGAGSATMQRARPGQDWRSRAALRALFCMDPLALQIGDADALTLAAGTLAVDTDAAPQDWRIQGGVSAPRAWWMSFDARAGR